MPNDEMNDTSYQFQVDFAKADLVDDNKDSFTIRGIATSTAVDRDNESMSEEAIKSMLAQIKGGKIPLVNEHGRRWDDRIGVVTDGEITQDGKLVIEGRLNKNHPLAQFLYKQIKNGENFGLSVAGKVKGFTQRMRTDLGKFVRTFNDVILNEISVTHRPANWDTMGLTAKSFMGEIAKSIPEEAWEQTEKGAEMEDETKVEETGAEAAGDTAEAVEDAAPAPEAEGTVEETEAVEKTGGKRMKRLPKAKREAMMKAFDDKLTELRNEFSVQLGLVDDEAEKSADEDTENEEVEELKKAVSALTEQVDKLSKLPLQRKGIAATGTEAIIKAKTDDEESVEDAPSFVAAYKKANYQE